MNLLGRSFLCYRVFEDCQCRDVVRGNNYFFVLDLAMKVSTDERRPEVDVALIQAADDWRHVWNAEGYPIVHLTLRESS